MDFYDADSGERDALWGISQEGIEDDNEANIDDNEANIRACERWQARYEE